MTFKSIVIIFAVVLVIGIILGSIAQSKIYGHAVSTEYVGLTGDGKMRYRVTYSKGQTKVEDVKPGSVIESKYKSLSR